MLVLSRHTHEQIVINGDIVVTVVRIEGNKVKLGIEAPREITVDRREVAIEKERDRKRLEGGQR
jgi:carbon storage regulator